MITVISTHLLAQSQVESPMTSTSPLEVYLTKHCSDVQSCCTFSSELIQGWGTSRAFACSPQCFVLYVCGRCFCLYLRTGVADQGSDQVIKPASYDGPPIPRSVSRLLAQFEVTLVVLHTSDHHHPINHIACD